MRNSRQNTFQNSGPQQRDDHRSDNDYRQSHQSYRGRSESFIQSFSLLLTKSYFIGNTDSGGRGSRQSSAPNSGYTNNHNNVAYERPNNQFGGKLKYEFNFKQL